jgi:hypothetical protein
LSAGYARPGSTQTEHLRRLHPRHASLKSNGEIRLFEIQTLPGLLDLEAAVVPDSQDDLCPHHGVCYHFGCSYCLLVSDTSGMLRQDYIVSHTSVRRGRDGEIVARHMVARECLTQFHYGETPQWQTVKFRPLLMLGSWSAGFRVKHGGHTSSGDKTAGKHQPG